MSNISKSFKEAFGDFITKRVVEDLGECLSEDTEYRRVTSEIETYADKIRDSENDEDFDLLFDRFDSLCGELESIIAHIMYMQGLRDGYRLYSLVMLE